MSHRDIIFKHPDEWAFRITVFLLFLIVLMCVMAARIKGSEEEQNPGYRRTTTDMYAESFAEALKSQKLREYGFESAEHKKEKKIADYSFYDFVRYMNQLGRWE